MRNPIINLIAIMIVFGIYGFAGGRGLVVAVGMILLFEFMHKRVYGKSIAEINN